MSVFFTTTGSGDLLAEGVGDGVAVADSDEVGEGEGIIFPESQAKTFLPLLLTLMQVKSLPLYVVVCPSTRHFIGGVLAANAGKAIMARIVMNPKPRIRREIGFTDSHYLTKVNIRCISGGKKNCNYSF